NRSLQKLVRHGTFREDLFYRLNVVKIDLPPLRDRPEDIPLLATHFAEKYSLANPLQHGHKDANMTAADFAQKGARPPKQISPAAMQVLLSYRWPGNVRELENAIERACVTSRDSFIEPENLPPEVTNPPAPKMPFHVDLDRPLPSLLREAAASIEQQYIRKALKKTRGNVGRCARICGLSRRSITAKITEYKI